MEEKLFLVCDSCGEAFDEMTTAKDHEVTCEAESDNRIEYSILPESEAF
jgi:ribosomal protein L31